MFFYIILSILFAAFIAADQITKYIAVTKLMPLETIPVIKNVLSFTYVENFGAAFGIMQHKKIVLLVITFLIAAAFIIYTIKTKNKNKVYLISLCLILSGAVGNLIDRISRGYVVDMIQVLFIDFPVFNIADCCVVIGAVLLCIYVLLKKE